MPERVETNWFTLSAEDLGEIHWKSIRMRMFILDATVCFLFLILFVVAQLHWAIALSISCAILGLIVFGQKKVAFALFRKPTFKHSLDERQFVIEKSKLWYRFRVGIESTLPTSCVMRITSDAKFLYVFLGTNTLVVLLEAFKSPADLEQSLIWLREGVAGEPATPQQDSYPTPSSQA